MKRPAVYILASRKHGTLYTGVTSDLPRRIAEHRNGAGTGFAARYGCHTLVYIERFEGMIDAILREKQIKAGSRAGKIALIQSINPDWRDLEPE